MPFQPPEEKPCSAVATIASSAKISPCLQRARWQPCFRRHFAQMRPREGGNMPLQRQGDPIHGLTRLTLDPGWHVYWVRPAMQASRQQ